MDKRQENIMTHTPRGIIPDRKSSIFFLTGLACLLVVAVPGCSGLSGFLGDVGIVAGGGELGSAGADTTTEQIVEGVRTGVALLPFPAAEVLTAVLSALAVFSYMKRRGDSNAQVTD